jgi:hypothetical protein
VTLKPESKLWFFCSWLRETQAKSEGQVRWRFPTLVSIISDSDLLQKKNGDI